MYVNDYNYMPGEPDSPTDIFNKKVKLMYNWPDPKEPGKTHGKDIMLICKRWYDREKYHTVKDALNQYYQERYLLGDPCEEPLSFKFINTVLLKPAVEELLNETFKLSFIDWIFNKHIVEPIESEGTTYDEILYYKIIGFLSNLYKSTGHDSSEILINTDEYWVRSNEEIVITDGHAILAHTIIK